MILEGIGYSEGRTLYVHVDAESRTVRVMMSCDGIADRELTLDAKAAERLAFALEDFRRPVVERLTEGQMQEIERLLDWQRKSAVSMLRTQNEMHPEAYQ